MMHTSGVMLVIIEIPYLDEYTNLDPILSTYNNIIANINQEWLKIDELTIECKYEQEKLIAHYIKLVQGVLHSRMTLSPVTVPPTATLRIEWVGLIVNLLI